MGKGKSEVGREYSDQIKKDGDIYGYKTANLMFLDGISEEFNRKNPDSNIQVAVPSFKSYSSEQIQQSLDSIAPEWRSKWQDFVKVFNDENPISDAGSNANSKKVLGPRSKEALKGLREYVEKNFVRSNLLNHLTKEGLSESSLLMVRSTGREDSTTMANPGGNESYPSLNNDDNIRSAAARVIASYFSEKSILQRISSGDDVTRDPFTPLLIQKMIGEGLSGNDSKDAELESKYPSSVVSGVMYSKDGSARIQAAPGHGELIVNSKGNFDSFYVTRDGMIYAEKQIKHDRMVSRMESSIEEDGTVRMRPVLKAIPNPTLDQYEFSLPPEVTYQLYELSKFIEEKYGMPMDTEFVYDRDSNTIYIVQTRPIPEGNMRGIKPSALNLSVLNSLAPESKFKGSTITKEVNNARIVRSKNELIVVDTIEEALTLYNNTSDKSVIKGVVVKKQAPDTGHEAGEFRSKGVAVLQIENLDAVGNLLESLDTNPIIIDPQRKSLYQLTSEQASDTELIKEGFFSSSMSSDVSAYVTAFTKLEEEEIQRLPDIKSLEDGHLGELISKAHASDEKIASLAISKISSFVFNNIEGVKGYTARELEGAVESLTNPGSRNLDAEKEKVQRTLKTVFRLRQKDMISQDVFVASMLGGAEMLVCLDKMSKFDDKAEPLGVDNKDVVDVSTHSVYPEYLNVCAKFQGLILSKESAPETLGSSVMKDLAKYKHEKEVSRYIERNKLTGEAKDVFIEAAKLEKFFINDVRKKQWLGFCAYICKDKEGAEQLGSIVGNIVKNGIAPQWCNLSVAPLLRESTNHLDAFEKIGAEYRSLNERMEQINEIDQLIREIKAQKAMWNEPEKFEKLYANFKTTFDKVKDKIQFNENDPVILQIMTSKQMMDLVDSMDLTLKTLGTSTLYENKKNKLRIFGWCLRTFINCSTPGFLETRLMQRLPAL